MAEPLRAMTPLGRDAPGTEAVGPVTIRESMDQALASLASRRGREAEVRARAEAVGIPLPGPGEAASGETWGALWLGPEQWMLEAPHGTHADVVAALRPLFGDAASLTEQTDGWARFEVEGPLEPLFERLCNLDLARFGPGSATRTAIEHVGVLAVRRGLGAMTLLGPRSSAGSLHHALLAAARSAF